MKAGDIILTSLPQADGKLKKRPALLLKQMPGHGDWLACGISTQLHEYIKDFDELLDASHPDYSNSHLLAPSVVRLSFLSTIASKNISGTIGQVSAKVTMRLAKNLTEYLLK